MSNKTNKRLTKKLTDVATEVRQHLIAHFNITQKQIDGWALAAKSNPHSFPDSKLVDISELYIDYEVQRDVVYKHIINIMKNWDPRVCGPVSACKLTGKTTADTYDGQHRTISATILGYNQIPCSIVHTDDPNFASYAFEMHNDSGVQRLTPGDLHRNALVRYKNGSGEIKNVQAFNMQEQFNKLGIDLEDKNTRTNPNLRGDNDYFFSHFKYAQKAVQLDEGKGAVLYLILEAIKEVFPLQEEIDQGVFIGLYELHRIANTYNIKLPAGWMKTLLQSIKPIFKASNIVHYKARMQWAYAKGDGATWTAPTAMSNFMREVHVYTGGTLNLPYHGEGSKMDIEKGNYAPGLFPETANA